MNLSLRPHHGLCVILFSEIGHSSPYASVMHKIITILATRPKTKVVLCAELDETCGFCPYNNKCICEKSEEVDVSGNQILSYCGLKLGCQLAWEDLRKKLIDNILNKGLLGDACKGYTYLPQCEGIEYENQTTPTPLT